MVKVSLVRGSGDAEFCWQNIKMVRPGIKNKITISHWGKCYLPPRVSGMRKSQFLLWSEFIRIFYNSQSIQMARDLSFYIQMLNFSQDLLATSLLARLMIFTMLYPIWSHPVRECSCLTVLLILQSSSFIRWDFISELSDLNILESERSMSDLPWQGRGW